MGEQDRPSVADPVKEIDRSLRRLRGEIRSLGIEFSATWCSLSPSQPVLEHRIAARNVRETARRILVVASAAHVSCFTFHQRFTPDQGKPRQLLP
jgi:hypothetical protein